MALGAAVLMGLGFFIQQHVAEQQPADERLSARLLLDLARRPVWLGGIGTMVLGQVLEAAALGRGGLALVTPMVSTNLLVALGLATWWRRCRLGRREWAGAFALVTGLAMFIAAGDPRGGSSVEVPLGSWLGAGLGVASAAAVLVYFGRRSSEARQASLLAGGAGLLYGLQDALTTRTLAQFNDGLVATLTSWPPYCLLVVAIVALELGQSAFGAWRLDASLPAITAAEPVTAIALGAGLYGEHLNMAPLPLAVELAGLFSLVAGVFVVAASPAVTRPGHCRERRALVPSGWRARRRGGAADRELAGHDSRQR